MQRWEYKVLVRERRPFEWRWKIPDKDKRSADEMLNDLGNDGWELTSILSVPDNERDVIRLVQYYLKRPAI